MKIGAAWALAGALLLAAASSAPAEDSVVERLNRLNWVAAPGSGPIAGVASIQLTGDVRFLGPADTRSFLELQGNPPREDEYAVAPKDMHWFAIFGYDRSGHVTDDEKIDPDELLRVLKQQNEAGIEERRKLKLPVLFLEGWAVPPHYDSLTRRLEWGTRLRGENGGTLVNYTVRLLGREGVMQTILVSDPDALDADIRSFKSTLEGFRFNPGQRYEEFRNGDSVAGYGLAALVVGGAAAAAAKSGGFAALKGFGKLIIVGAIGAVAAGLGFLKRLFGSRGPSA